MIGMKKRYVFAALVLSFLLGAVFSPGVRLSLDGLQAAQNFTDDSFRASGSAAQEDLQNMENNFLCLKSSFSGASSPANPVAGMFWYDTTANMLKLRNETNSAWLDVYDFANARSPLALLATNCSRTVLAGTGISVSGSLTSGNVTVSIPTGGISNALVGNGQIGAEKLQTGTDERTWVMARYASAPAGSVGSLIFAVASVSAALGNEIMPGETTAGANLRPAGSGLFASTPTVYTSDYSLTGTWRALGYAVYRSDMLAYDATLWVRVS